MSHTGHIEQPAPEQPPALRAYPSKLFVEVTTRCNLRCAMCVKQAPGRGVVDGDMTDETFERLAPALPRLDALVLNGIGESLLHPRLEAYIGAGKRAMGPQAWIGFQTNGQLLDRERALSLVRAGVDKICVSADAVAPEVFRALRGGGMQAAVETALGALDAAARACGRAVSLGVEFVAMRNNVEQLPDLMRWAARNHVAFVIVTHMLPYNERMAGAAAYDTNSDRAMQLFREWKTRAAAHGVDIERYFEVFMKFRRSREEERIVEYVSRMVDDATSRGVSLNVARLFKCDEPMVRHVHEIFEEAGEIARREGIDLRLPATTPRNEKRCDFVEDGSAFVSWDGDLHPCYFLWHKYQCYIGGALKQVRPQSFGNLKEQGVLDIWNGAAWRSFRDQTRKYEFPSCHDCNVALCDYVQGEDFTQDCHLGTVPCPSCLWCTGVFQCLR